MQGPSIDGAPSYLARRPRTHHPVFGARAPVTERTLEQHALILEAIAQAQGRSLNANEINQYVVQRVGAVLRPHTVYRGLKHLFEAGRLEREWSERNGRASASYRLPVQSPAPQAQVRGRLECRACARTVDLSDAQAWFKALADACEANGMVLSHERLKIGALCRTCGG